MRSRREKERSRFFFLLLLLSRSLARISILFLLSRSRRSLCGDSVEQQHLCFAPGFVPPRTGLFFAFSSFSRARAHPPLLVRHLGCAASGRLRVGGAKRIIDARCLLFLLRSRRRTRREAPSPRHPSLFWPFAVSATSPDAFLMSSRHQWMAREMPNVFVRGRVGRALVSFSSSVERKIKRKKTTVACGIFVADSPALGSFSALPDVPDAVWCTFGVLGREERAPVCSQRRGTSRAGSNAGGNPREIEKRKALTRRCSWASLDLFSLFLITNGTTSFPSKIKKPTSSIPQHSGSKKQRHHGTSRL